MERKLLGEPKLPLKLVRALFLLLLRACCSCCLALPGSPWLTGCSLEWGANSKRISLDADAAINQPVRVLPEGSFVVLGLVAGAEPLAATPLQKNQLAAPPSLLFLLFWSRYVLFLLCGALLVIVVVPEIKQMPCQFLRFLLNQRFAAMRRDREGRKKPGFRYL